MFAKGGSMSAQEVLPIELEVKPQQQSLVPSAPTPMDLLQMAVAQQIEPEKLGQLLALQERWEANEACKAYVSAMNAFKKSPPIIRKNKHVHFDSSKGPVDYDHATLDHICDQVTKALSEHGISHAWKIDDATMPLKVTCILTHERGHSEETSMRGDPDETGSKNKLQARSSTVQYLQRYTLLAATGLAPAEPDNDGRPDTTNGELAEQIEYLANASTPDELQKLYVVAYRMFEDNPAAIKALIQAKKGRKTERGW
jgi:hypothetical protein